MLQDSWWITPTVTQSKRGMVASQSARAARIGAKIIEEGGNAVDAAVATAFALTVLEPWMSGIGGGGVMVVCAPGAEPVAIDFAMPAPANLSIEDFILDEMPASAPEALTIARNDANITGALSVGVPGAVAGYAELHRRYGRIGWSRVLAPAIELAVSGHPVHWWTTLNITTEASRLGRNAAARDTWLPNGLVPVPTLDDRQPSLALGALAQTLQSLADDGPEAFYTGRIAADLSDDIQALGGKLTLTDLGDYRVMDRPPLSVMAGEHRIYLVAGPTAGPTFDVARQNLRHTGTHLDGETYADWADALHRALVYRYQHQGADCAPAGTTTHLCTADDSGLMVSMTTTLLRPFGAAMVSPRTGIMLNNAVAWFDLRPDQVNSLRGACRPLTNMCPLLATKNGRASFALGASGGRRIMPCVFQIASMLCDHGFSPAEAFAAPRIDLSAVHSILADPMLGRPILDRLSQVLPVTEQSDTIFPVFYATPLLVCATASGLSGVVRRNGPVHGAVGV